MRVDGRWKKGWLISRGILTRSKAKSVAQIRDKKIPSGELMYGYVWPESQGGISEVLSVQGLN